MGNSVRSVGETAFYRCYQLSSAVFTNSLETIEDNAFCACQNLETLTVGNSLSSIGELAFWGCSSLKEVILPDTLKVIPEKAFRYCSGIESLVLGNAVLEIGDFAFEDCENLATISIPNTITKIGERAFHGTAYVDNPDNWEDNWTTLYIETQTEGNYYLLGVSEVTEEYTIKDGTIGIASWLCDYETNNGRIDQLKSLVIPDSVKYIGDRAFVNFVNLESVEIGSGVVRIGEYAFENCSKLAAAKFKVVEGWDCEGDEISEEDLEKLSTSASYLKAIYLSDVWTRT